MGGGGGPRFFAALPVAPPPGELAATSRGAAPPRAHAATRGGRGARPRSGPPRPCVYIRIYGVALTRNALSCSNCTVLYVCIPVPVRPGHPPFHPIHGLGLCVYCTVYVQYIFIVQCLEICRQERTPIGHRKCGPHAANGRRGGEGRSGGRAPTEEGGGAPLPSPPHPPHAPVEADGRTLPRPGPFLCYMCWLDLGISFPPIV